MTNEEFDPKNDPGRWASSLLNVREIIMAMLDARSPSSVLEIGAHAGDLTAELLRWAEPRGARVSAIDPLPADDLRELAAAHPELTLIERTSQEALAEIDVPEVVLIDGDHNYYTVSEELRLIAERAGAELPLLILHDVGWPHARRDSYYDPERIPESDRQSMVERGGIMPGDPGQVEGALPLPWMAVREGGPRNGVRTAIEDFVVGREGLRFAALAPFFGLGVIWDGRATWNPGVAAAVEPYESNPVIERLEANRVWHIAFGHTLYTQVLQAHAEIERLRAELERERA